MRIMICSGKMNLVKCIYSTKNNKTMLYTNVLKIGCKSLAEHFQAIKTIGKNYLKFRHYYEFNYHPYLLEHLPDIIYISLIFDLMISGKICRLPKFSIIYGNSKCCAKKLFISFLSSFLES